MVINFMIYNFFRNCINPEKKYLRWKTIFHKNIYNIIESLVSIS